MGRSRGGVGISVALLVTITSGIVTISLFASQWVRKFPALREITTNLPRIIRDIPGSPPEGFNPNSVAGALLFTLPLLVVLLWPVRTPVFHFFGRYTRWLVYPLFGAAFLLVGGVLFLSQSRGGYLGILVGLLMLLLLPKRWMLGLGLVASLALGVWSVRGGLAPLLPLLDAGGIAGSSGAITSFEGRLEIWASAMRGMHDFPLTGMGMGTFRRVAPALYPLSTIPANRDIGHAHNHLLAAGVDLGIPGLIAYLALWMGAWAMCWDVWQRARVREARTLALGLAGGLIANFTWGFFDANVLGSKAGISFWLALGAIAALHRYVTVKVPEEVA